MGCEAGAGAAMGREAGAGGFGGCCGSAYNTQYPATVIITEPAAKTARVLTEVLKFSAPPGNRARSAYNLYCNTEW
jgi:hypothetical protein